MKKRVIVIPKDDLIYYPPTISLLKILIKLGCEVECLGEYSDSNGKMKLEEEGVRFVPIYRKVKDESRFRLVNWLIIIIRLFKYKKEIKRYLGNTKLKENDLIWFMHTDSIGVLQKYLEKHPYVVQFYEFEDYTLGGLSKIIHPGYNVKRYLQNAKALIHCEYNRAMITNGLYGVSNNTFVLPNKPFELGDEFDNVPKEIKEMVESIKERTKGKFVILYQGIFNQYERRLDEFCEAMSHLSDNHVLLCMGGSSGDYFEKMRMKYESEKVVFIPFVKPPYHLLITKLSSLGIMAYFPASQSYVGVINPLYCAPNKIFEYSKYSKPMIANDVPALRQVFEKYQCGDIISFPATPQKIADTVLRIRGNYDTMSEGSKRYYDSVDLEKIVKEIVESTI